MPTPRLYPITVNGVVNALIQIFDQNIYAHKVIAQTLKEHKKWGSRDRSFVAFSTYEMVRHWRNLWSLLGQEPELTSEKIHHLFGVWWLSQGNVLPDWKEFEALKDFDLEAAFANQPQSIEIIESYPDWLHQRASQELGDAWPEIAADLNEPAPLCLRTNTIKIDAESLSKQLNAEGLINQRDEENSATIFMEGSPRLTSHPLFAQGYFEIQDAGSQMIAPFLDPKPGETVIDACAGAGGKSLHLAALMQNKGSLTALDTFPKKLDELKIRGKRGGVKILSTEKINKNTVVKFSGKADKLLLDVPCSGTGVIKRDVDTKWKLTEEHLQKNINLQRDLLTRYTAMVKKGGTFVYATCSILPSENESQTTWFIDNFSHDFEFISEERINPSPETDGFYMAKFVRK